MSGENIRRLQRAVTPMSVGDVETSESAWSGGAVSLANVEGALNLAEPGIIAGFGEGTDIATTAKKAIDGMRKKVVERKTDMTNAFNALVDVKLAMQDAQEVALAQSDVESPGTAPTFPTNVGPDEEDQIRAIKQHGARTRLYNDRVAAYNDEDVKARKALDALDKAYDEAIPVFQKIHGEPVDGPTGTKPGPGPGGVPGGVRPPIYTPPPGGLVGIDNDDPRDPDIHVDIDDPRDPDLPDIDIDDPRDPDLPDIGDPGDPDIGNPGNPGIPGIGGPGGINPGLLGGGLLAGGLAAPGAIKGIRGLLSRGGLTGGAQAIGASTRAGGPGSLGRSGALAPGSPVARGAGGRGAGGARGAGGRGVPGAQGGRGGRGGRGAAAGAAGGRGGRRKDGEREGADRELYDDGQDWLDDEGTAPGVLG